MEKEYYEVVWSSTISNIPISEGHDKRDGNLNRNMLMYYSFKELRDWFNKSSPDISLSRLNPEYYLVKFDKEKGKYERIKI